MGLELDLQDICQGYVHCDCFPAFTRVIFYEPKTLDPDRDWEAYHAWDKKGESPCDRIYHIGREFIDRRLIEEDDRILLYMRMADCGDVLHLTNIQRNMADDLKGLGAKAVSELCDRVADQYVGLALLPLGEKLRHYWKRVGFKELRDLTEEEVRHYHYPIFDANLVRPFS